MKEQSVTDTFTTDTLHNASWENSERPGVGFGSFPELLAPVGNEEMLKAALENGADAVYFGVQAFNARMRANNFRTEELPELISRIHERGVKAYLTLNVLIFQEELEEAVELLLAASQAGVDAIIVQDLGLAWLARKIVPDLPVHASTQMTISSAEGIAALEMLGIDCERVVVARELSTSEIARIRRDTSTELEVFIHGALCVAYSGQCLTSEALGGRSANRGECAQACRLPYSLIVDGEERPLDDIRYLVSPKDLAGYAEVPELARLGVSSLKIEGRLKSPEYVAATLQAYREARERSSRPLLKGSDFISGTSLAKLENTFSRGFTGGYLHANDHQAVVDGKSSSKRGPLVAHVLRIEKNGILVESQIPLLAGDGVLIEDQEDGQGARIFEIEAGKRPREQLLHFRPGQIQGQHLRPGAKVWKTSDPRIERDLRTSFVGEQIRYQRPISIEVRAGIGKPIRVLVNDDSGLVCEVESNQPVEKARNQPLTETVLREQLGRLGGTPFVLHQLKFTAEDGFSPAPLVMVPLSHLNELRRQFVDRLIHLRRTRNTTRRQDSAAWEQLAGIHVSAVRREKTPDPIRPRLSVLCRTLEQVRTVVKYPIDTVYTDFEDQRLHNEARQIVEHQCFAPTTIRVMKPAEDGMLRKIIQAKPDAVLVRNLAAWKVLCAEGYDMEFRGDYSLNLSNTISADLILQAGFQRITPSYDLNFEQLRSFLGALPHVTAHAEVTIHQRIPMFHMEHCVFCRFLSTGTNSTNCGRPCEKHFVALKDRKGFEHPLKADYACRNTLFNAIPQSAAEYLPGLIDAGIQLCRIDLLEEDAQETAQVVELYLGALAGEVRAKEIWQILQVSSKLGVTRGGLDHERKEPHRLYSLPSRQPGRIV